MTTQAWRSARRVLCVRLDQLGDVLMSTPAMRALKRSVLDRELTLLTSPGGGRLAGMLPDVDQVMTYEAPWMKASTARADAQADGELIARLRAGSFDAAVIFTVFSQNPLPAALVCYLAGIPLRLAYCRENPYQLLTDWVQEEEPQVRIRHEVRRQLDLVATVGCRTLDEQLTLAVPEAAVAQIRDRLTKRGLDFQRPWLVIHPGATAPSRRYPPESFARVTAELVRRHGFQAVFTGMEDERSLVARAGGAYGRRTISLAGELDLVELAALLTLAPVLLANNTGPVHMAAALGTPVVDLYALTNPQHTPWNVPHRVLYHDVVCKYCFKSSCPMGHQRCLDGVEPAAVVAAVLDLYEEIATRGWMDAGESVRERGPLGSVVSENGAASVV